MIKVEMETPSRTTCSLESALEEMTMRARPNNYRLFQVTGVVTNLIAVVLMVAFKGLTIHKGLFGVIEGSLCTAPQK